MMHFYLGVIYSLILFFLSDHHCEFTNCCVGKQNHSRFFLFLVVQAALVIFGLGLRKGRCFVFAKQC